MESSALPQFNFALAAATAVIPIILGFIWYNPKTFGPAFIKGAGLTEESAKGMNMIVVFGITYVLGFLMSIFLQVWTIHQFALGALQEPARGFTDPAGFKEALNAAAEISQHKFRSWTHGLAHGTFLSITLLLPVIAVNGMFERRGWKYIFIHWGFWTLCAIIMGMILCQFV